MKKELIITGDGSHTISIPEMGVSYHSVHGAIQESKHVFIEAGLKFFHLPIDQPISILEMGFGTGLNAFLTAIEAKSQKQNVYYTAVELFPIYWGDVKVLNYPDLLQHGDLFQRMHECEWNEEVNISDYFVLRKEKTDLIAFSTQQIFDLIYYDAFAPAAQPELWSKEVFEKLFGRLQPNGILVTYCAKGDVRRAMMAAGFDVKKLPGPPGKREMLRAIKA